MLTMQKLAEIIVLLVLYDLVLKESIIKPLIVEFTQAKIRRYLPYFMQYLDGQVYKAVVNNDATVLEDIPKFTFPELSESEHNLLVQLAIQKYDPLVFIEKAINQTNDHFK